MVMGMPGSGKTTLAREVAGLRLDRDERGGTLADIARTIVIGSTPADRGFATRLGVAFQRPPGASE